MKPNHLKRTMRDSSKMKGNRAEAIAKALGVSASAVWNWRRNGSYPRNPKIRAAYLKAEGLTEPTDSPAHKAKRTPVRKGVGK